MPSWTSHNKLAYSYQQTHSAYANTPRVFANTHPTPRIAPVPSRIDCIRRAASTRAVAGAHCVTSRSKKHQGFQPPCRGRGSNPRVQRTNDLKSFPLTARAPQRVLLVTDDARQGPCNTYTAQGARTRPRNAMHVVLNVYSANWLQIDHSILGQKCL